MDETIESRKGHFRGMATPQGYLLSKPTFEVPQRCRNHRTICLETTKYAEETKRNKNSTRDGAMCSTQNPGTSPITEKCYIGTGFAHWLVLLVVTTELHSSVSGQEKSHQPSTANECCYRSSTVVSGGQSP